MADRKTTSATTGRWAATGVVLAVVLGLAACSSGSDEGHGADATDSPAAERDESQDEKHRVEIHSARNLGKLEVATGAPPPYQTGGISCGTCHDHWVTGPQAETPAELEGFHQNMRLEHGELTCSSCHHPDDRDKLRLANNKSIGFEDTIELCGQCHGPQLRDYRHGAHGGMSGHWDLEEGPRVRNHCVNCHDPHAPDFPTVEPAPGPRDRGTMQSSGH